MDIKATLEGADVFRERIQLMDDAASDLDPALRMAGALALHAGQERIDAGGPGWKPNLAGTPLLKRTWRLYSSLDIETSAQDVVTHEPDTIMQISGNTIEAGTSLKYARWLQEGTGIYGPSGEPIRPKRAKFLHFWIGDQEVFAKSVKGMPPRPFLFIDDPLEEKIGMAFEEHIMGDKTT